MTERQRQIYDFIREKIEERGFGPTVREIGDAFDIRHFHDVVLTGGGVPLDLLATRVHEYIEATKAGSEGNSH